MRVTDLLFGLCVGRICVFVFLFGMFHTGFAARSRSRTHGKCNFFIDVVHNFEFDFEKSPGC